MKLWQGWPGQNRFCCFGHFLAPGRFFPSLVPFPLILFFVGVFGLIELPRISGFWWMIVVVCSGLLLLGALMACLQAMTTQPGFQVRRSVLPALTLSKDGFKTTSDLCKMYASCCRPPRFSDPAKKAEERLKAQEGFQKETQAHMTWNRYHVWRKMRRLGNLIWKRQKTSGTNACGTWGNALRARFNIFLALHIAMLQMLQCEVRGKRWILRVVHFLKCLLDRKLCWSSKPSTLPFLCVGLVNTSYLHEFHGLAFDAKDKVLIGVACAARRMQPSRRLERAGWVVLAMVFGILPFAPLIVEAMEALPGLALTSMLTEQLGNLGKGLNMKQSAVQSSTEKSHTFSVQTFIEWSRVYGMFGWWRGRRCIGTWDGTCSAWTLAPCWWRSSCRLGLSWDAFVWFHLWTHEELFGELLEPFLPRRGCPIYCNSKFPLKRWSRSSLSEQNMKKHISHRIHVWSKEV